MGEKPLTQRVILWDKYIFKYQFYVTVDSKVSKINDHYSNNVNNSSNSNKDNYSNNNNHNNNNVS